MSSARKAICLAAGLVLTGLAFLGIVVPLLPTTPLLILAAACFAQSSDRWHRWLMDHHLFGPLLQNWQAHRCIPRRAKIVAVILILLFGGYAVGFAIRHALLRIAGGAFLLTGLFVVLRIPCCPADPLVNRRP